jgi:AcrR family transcriptional regulator
MPDGQRTAAARSKRVQQGETTRGVLIDTAQRLFAERGYAGTSTADIVTAAKVTRGALYHHFRDKEDLFRAVLEATEERMLGQVAVVAAQADTPLAQLHAGIDASFALSLEPVFRRIVLEDGPAVLGWQAWHEIDARYAYGAMEAGLRAAMDCGELPAQPAEPLAHLLVGAFMQGAMVVARAADPAAATRSMTASMHRLIDGLTLIEGRTAPAAGKPRLRGQVGVLGRVVEEITRVGGERGQHLAPVPARAGAQRPGQALRQGLAVA